MDPQRGNRGRGWRGGRARGGRGRGGPHWARGGLGNWQAGEDFSSRNHHSPVYQPDTSPEYNMSAGPSPLPSRGWRGRGRGRGRGHGGPNNRARTDYSRIGLDYSQVRDKIHSAQVLAGQIVEAPPDRATPPARRYVPGPRNARAQAGPSERPAQKQIEEISFDELELEQAPTPPPQALGLGYRPDPGRYSGDFERKRGSGMNNEMLRPMKFVQAAPVQDTPLRDIEVAQDTKDAIESTTADGTVPSAPVQAEASSLHEALQDLAFDRAQDQARSIQSTSVDSAMINAVNADDKTILAKITPAESIDSAANVNVPPDPIALLEQYEKMNRPTTGQKTPHKEKTTSLPSQITADQLPDATNKELDASTTAQPSNSIPSRKSVKLDKKQKRAKGREAKREAWRRDNLALDLEDDLSSRSATRRTDASDMLEAREGSDIDWGDAGPPSNKKKRNGKGQVQQDLADELVADYLANVQANDDSDSDSGGAHIDGSTAFVRGGGPNVNQERIDELRPLSCEDDWSTTDQSEDYDGQEDSEDEGDILEIETRAMAQGQYDDGSDSEDDDDFNGRSKWEEEDDFLDEVQQVLDDNAHLLRSKGNRSDRNKLFQQISNGTFDEPRLPGNKGKKRNTDLIGLDEEFAESIEAQWNRDKAKKAAKKLERERARRELAQLEGHKGGRIGKKAARRAEKRRTLLGDDYMAELDRLDRDEGFVGLSGRAMSIDVIHDQIRLFMFNEAMESLSLPSMDKSSRAQVHALAGCYNLKSKSIGKGELRFPTLIKTGRSRPELVKEGRVQSVLRAGRQSDRYGGNIGAMFKAAYAKGRDSTAARPDKPGSREGAVVGANARQIGEDNVGHQMLAKMGWMPGMRIGVTSNPGRDVPIEAIIKTSRLGLGL